jgi:bacterioferritin-associated ferredoxin
MFVCICNQVSERKVHEAAHRGVRTLEELSELLGVATGCGTCTEFARDCLAEAVAELEASAPPARSA